MDRYIENRRKLLCDGASINLVEVVLVFCPRGLEFEGGSLFNAASFHVEEDNQL
jgi:hypothetical protein